MSEVPQVFLVETGGRPRCHCDQWTFNVVLGVKNQAKSSPRVSEVAARVSWPPLCHQKQPVSRPTMMYCRMSCLLMD